MHAVGESFFGLMVDFDENRIGTNGDGGTGERKSSYTASPARRIRADEAWTADS